LKPLIVLYYHRILPFKGYDIDIDTFEWQLSFLKKHFEILPPEGLLDLRGGLKLNKTSVLLTFDDGFRDNFVYAYPILESFRVKALLFVITSKITHREVNKTQRETKENLFIPKADETALYDSTKGNMEEFLSWEELKILKKRGVFEIGSHSHSHMRVFTSDMVTGIWKERNSAHWSYEYALSETPKVGYPIFPMGSELSFRRFYPKKEFLETVRLLYHKYKDEKKTIEEANKVRDKGHFETNDEYKARVTKDLETSRLLIKENIGLNSTFLSWPWGEFSKTSLEIAQKAGFEFCFTTEKRVFSGRDFCRIGRLKSSRDRLSFIRKLMLNKFPFTAKVYELWHR